VVQFDSASRWWRKLEYRVDRDIRTVRFRAHNGGLYGVVEESERLCRAGKRIFSKTSLFVSNLLLSIINRSCGTCRGPWIFAPTGFGLLSRTAHITLYRSEQHDQRIQACLNCLETGLGEIAPDKSAWRQESGNWCRRFRDAGAFSVTYLVKLPTSQLLDGVDSKHGSYVSNL